MIIFVPVQQNTVKCSVLVSNIDNRMNLINLVIYYWFVLSLKVCKQDNILSCVIY